MRARVAEGMIFISDAKTVVNINSASGAIGYAAGHGNPTVGTDIANSLLTVASKNVASVEISGTVGTVTLTTSAIAGNGTLIATPYTGGTDAFGTGGVALITAVTQTPLPNPTAVIKWRCKSIGAIGFGAVGTLESRYAPSECR